MNLRLRFLVLFVLLAGMGLYMALHRDQVVPMARPFSEFPPSHEGWRMAGQSTLSSNILKILKPTDYLSRRYVATDGSQVDMYLSYFDGGPDSGGIHSPKHCVAGAGWTELYSQPSTVELSGEKVNLVRSAYAKGGSKEVIYYWFAMRGKTMSDEYSLKLSAITGSIFHRRRDQSFIRISIMAKENVEQAEEQIREFLRAFYPLIRDFLPS